MADDGKRTEQVCFKVTERMALDLLRLATADDRSPSDFIFNMLRRELYGRMVKLEEIAVELQSLTK